MKSLSLVIQIFNSTYQDEGKDFDAIIIPGYYTEAGKIVNQARGMGIDKPIVGGDGFNGAEFVQQATPAKASNIYYISGYFNS